MKRLLLGCVPTALFLSACMPAHVTESYGVSGTVLDAKTGRPINTAIVRCNQSAEIIANTEQNGSFSLPAKSAWHLVPVGGEWLGGRCTLAVQAAGYQSMQIDVVPGDDLPKTLRLEPSH